MIKYVKKSNNRISKIRKAFFLVGEFVLLVTMMVGIAAAARLILQSPLLQSLSPASGGIPVCTGYCISLYSTCQITENANSNLTTCGSFSKCCTPKTPTAVPTRASSTTCPGFTKDKTPSYCIATWGPCQNGYGLMGNAYQANEGCSSSKPYCCYKFIPTPIPTLISSCPSTFGSALTRCHNCLLNASQTECNQMGCCGTTTQTGGCYWSAGTNTCEGTPLKSPCYLDQGGGACIGSVDTCNTNYHNTSATICTALNQCVADYTTQCLSINGGTDTGGGMGTGNTGGGGTGLNICDAGFECKKTDNCPACNDGSCIGCQKANGPGICCPVPTIPPPGGEPPPVETQPPGGNPPGTAPGTACSPASTSTICQSLKIGDICDVATQNKCTDEPNHIKDGAGTDALPVCTCGTSGAVVTPPPGSPTAVPPIDPTKTDWYAQGNGELCTSKIFRTYFSDTKCHDYAKIGFQTENLPNPLPCNSDGTGYCYKANGIEVTRKPVAYNYSADPTCNPVTDESGQSLPIFRNPLFHDSPLVCSFDVFPGGNISGSVKVEAVNQTQYTRVGIFAKDITDGVVYVASIDFNNKDKDPANDIKSNETKPFAFNNLFNEHTYEIYAKAYRGKKTVQNIENIAVLNLQNENPCPNGVCQTAPKDNQPVDITLKFKPPTAEDIARQKTNDKIEQWIKDYEAGKCNAICMSKRFKELQEGVGLKTETCDPGLAGGCDFEPNDD